MVIRRNLRKAKILLSFMHLLMFVGGGFCAYGDAGSTGIIDLRQSANLKMIFDGGLRPYRVDGLENSSCAFDKARLEVIVPNASPFTFTADRGSINVLADDGISSIDLFGNYTTVADAAALVKSICSAWNVPSTGLDQTLQALGSTSAANRGWGQEYNASGIRARVMFKPLNDYNHLEAYVNVSFDIAAPPGGAKFLTTPIQPPPGYENVSMTPPPLQPTGRAVPGMSWEQAQSQISQQLTPKGQQPGVAGPSAIPQGSPSLSLPSDRKDSEPWLIYVLTLLAVILMVGMGYFFYSRRTKG
jgi:hypothetical protein